MTKGPRVNTRLRWHVDYYLTGEYWNFEWKRQNQTDRFYTLGAGRIKRGPSSLARPDPTAPRKWIYSNSIELAGKSFKDPQATETLTGPFVIFLYTHSDGATPPTTTFRVGFFPAKKMNYHRGGNTYEFVNLRDAYSGFFEEALNIASSSVIGVWVAPMIGDIYADMYHFENPTASKCYYWAEAGDMSYAPFKMTLTPAIKTDDTKKYIIEDPLGTVYATLPWEVESGYVYMSIDIGTNGAWLDLFFSNSSSSIFSTWEAGEGREVKIPLPAVPVNENAYGEYALTGQREYDISMARMQQEQNAVNGIAGVGTSAIGGAIAGSMVAPGPGTVAGAVAGIATGAISTATNFFSAGHYDAKAQEQMDKLTANQTSNVIINAGGLSWFNQDRRWRIIELVRDSESAAELSAEQSELGYVTDSYTTDCASVVATGGGLRIEGLEVRGGLPPEGRAYIAALFARGVHLDLIS